MGRRDMRPSPSPRPLRVGIYARFSSENQRDASIEDQVRICRARAQREGWDITATFTDYALSGSTTLRPGYQSLLSAMRSGQIDIALSESLDRFSRDQEHVAGFHKAALFAEVRIITLSEGEISELHVGLKGTMGALYLKDLADKTRRGPEGRVREGRSGGGLCYGYQVIRGPVTRNGTPSGACARSIPSRRPPCDGFSRPLPRARARNPSRPPSTATRSQAHARHLAGRHPSWTGRQGDGDPPQPPLHRRAGVEPAPLAQGPRDGPARCARQRVL
jgi:DNA invertase Pin-like site-specific DNA recombinase